MSSDLAIRNPVEREERFVELPLGSFWTVRPSQAGRANGVGPTVILHSVHKVDGDVHSVTVVVHSDHWDLSTYYDDRIYESHFSYLIDDFLEIYDLDPQAPAVKAKELAAAQEEVNRQLSWLPAPPATGEAAITGGMELARSASTSLGGVRRRGQRSA